MARNEMLRREGYGPSSLVVGERGARTRQRIVTQTLHLFEEQGFHATSVDAIAKAVGISRATLYQYFESKEDIFVELLEECGTALMRVVRRLGALGPTAAGYDNLHWWLGEWAYVYDKYATMFIQWATVDTSSTEVRPLVTGFSRSYNEKIAERLAACGIEGMAPIDAATALSAIVHRFHFFRHRGYAPTMSSDELLDGLAVGIQLLLFPETQPAAFESVHTVAPGTRPRRRRTPALIAVPTRTADLRPRALATVQLLVEAGARLFAARGYHGTGVDDIVGEAGFARGTFYKYFDEKQDLLVELTRECAQGLVDMAPGFTAVDATEAGRARLRAWLGDYLPFYHRQSGVMRAWFEGDVTDPVINNAARTAAEVLRDAAVDAFSKVERRVPLDVEIAATIFGAALELLPESVLQQDEHRTDDQIVEVMALTVERALLGVRGS